MKRIKVGLIGFGTIGSGVAETLRRKRSVICERSGLDVILTKICDKSPKALKSAGKAGIRLTKDPNDILGDRDIDIVIELIGGIKAARDIVVRAIRAKKHVVTANKALLAVCGKEIFALAEAGGVSVGFEASVAGSIPIVKSLREGFVSNRIDTIYGIINGTSNFILTEMRKDKRDFRTALKEAQKKGFAEKDPRLDINGVDSAHKLALLALIGFKVPVDFKNIYVEGIEDIEASDIEYAGDMGYTVKLLAIAKRTGRELEVRVHPTLLPKGHVLSNVDGVYNAIHLKGDLIGESLFYGKGAGKYPTSSAVISDIIDIGSRLKAHQRYRMPGRNIENEIEGIKEFGAIKIRHYIRFSATDKPGVLAKISGILGRHHISISSVTQKERRESHVVPIVMMTHAALEADMQKALREIVRLGVIKRKPVRIRVEG